MDGVRGELIAKHAEQTSGRAIPTGRRDQADSYPISLISAGEQCSGASAEATADIFVAT